MGKTEVVWDPLNQLAVNVGRCLLPRRVEELCLVLGFQRLRFGIAGPTAAARLDRSEWSPHRGHS